MTKLSEKQCSACAGQQQAMSEDQVKDDLSRVDQWEHSEAHHIQKEFQFPDFQSALDFVNRVGELAEQQQHHPNIFLSYGFVRILLYTHKVDGLTEPDFIMAAKIDELPRT